jgi:hypothetical protein
VSKQLYHEATLAYISNRYFILADYKAANFLFHWLSQLDRGFEHVRRLNIVDYNATSTIQSNLLSRCNRIVDLTIQTP